MAIETGKEKCLRNEGHNPDGSDFDFQGRTNEGDRVYRCNRHHVTIIMGDESHETGRVMISEEGSVFK
jgi:hypothetical protein